MANRRYNPRSTAHKVHAVEDFTCSKYSWRSRADAKRALTQARNRRRATGQRDHMEQALYRCPHCDWWHLTSRTQRKKT